MGAEYGFDPNVSSAISQMEQAAVDYEAKIDDLGNLIRKITLSNEWKDLNVKSSFIATLDGYMQVYRTLLLTMKTQIIKLKNKVNKMGSLEDTFSQG